MDKLSEPMIDVKCNHPYQTLALGDKLVITPTILGGCIYLPMPVMLIVLCQKYVPDIKFDALLRPACVLWSSGIVALDNNEVWV